MFALSVIYPNQPGAEFDLEYYITTHMRLVQERLGPGGMTRYELAWGVSGWPPDTEAPDVMICMMYFDTLDALRQAFGAHSPELIADIRMYTTIKPRMQVSEIFG